jgi:purine-binding chemotaxis protein CheW
MADEAERQLVVFDLAGEAYGVNIGTVREIIRMQAVTHVPETPEYVEGVINLRGRVIPVVDLRRRFGLVASEHTAESRIVVVDIAGNDIGVIVDAVTEVLRVAGSAIETASALIASEDSYYMDGIAKIGDRLLILLDLDRVLQASEDTLVRVASSSTAASAA